jgi:septal ring-binding cell division protein DamX
LKSTNRVLVGLIALGLLASYASADYQGGLDAYLQGNYEQALTEWQQVITSPPSDVHPSERAETFYAVAMLFWIGQGVTQDTSTSAGFLRQAAELNHAGAQSKLGYLYLIGQGVPANAFEAGKWLEMAARQGDADAQYNLAVMYRDGIGVDANAELALQWFKEAASQGDPVSAEVIAEYERRGQLQAVEEPIPVPVAAETMVDAGQTTVPDTSVEPVAAALDPATEPVTAALDPATETVTETLETPAEQVTAALPTAEPEDLPVNQDTALAAVPAAFDENWVLSRNPQHYTIQVIALRNLQSMLRLINDHPQWAPFAVYLQGEQDSPLYVLIQGDYPDAEAVKIAQQDFPASLAGPKQLWVRRFSMVQGLISGRQQSISENAEAARVTD